MKALRLIIISAILLSACNEDHYNVDRITIKGELGTLSKSGNISGKKSVAADLLDAKKVLVFYGTRYDLFEISDGSFSVNAETGNPTALVFLDGSNNYIGNLFAGGLNMLPLGDVGESVTVIDLNSLTLDGTSVIPSHDPIGEEIDITEEEAIRYRELGTYYESLSKNIDADNDGVPDILDKKDIRINSQFRIFGGSWGVNDLPPSQFDISDLRINYAVRIEGNISMAPANGNNVTLSGPEDNPYTDIARQGYQADKDCYITFFVRPGESLQDDALGNNFLPFKMGTYSFTLDGSKNFTLNFSNIDARYYLVIASPTLHTDDNGMITSVSVDYILPDNTVVDPENYVTILQLQFQNKDGSRLELGSLYESVQTKITLKDLTNIALTDPIPLSNLDGLSVNYNDILGNEYNVVWR